MQSKIFKTIIFIIFRDSLMFYQVFLSPQVRRCAVNTYKHGIYELPDDLRLRISESYKILGKCLNFTECLPTAQYPIKK